MRVEPLGPHVPPRRPPPPGYILSRLLVRRAAATAATALLLGSIGDGVVVALLLMLAAADVAPGVVASLAAAATVLRFGSSSLEALAGAQAVLGPGGVVGPTRAAASTWLAASALVLGAPGGLQAIPFGVAAGALVCGPAPRTPPDLLLRGGAAVLGAGLAWMAGRWLPPWLVWPAAGLGAAAVVLVADRRHAFVGPALDGVALGAAVALAAALLVVVLSRLASWPPAPSR